MKYKAEAQTSKSEGRFLRKSKQHANQSSKGEIDFKMSRL